MTGHWAVTTSAATTTASATTTTTKVQPAQTTSSGTLTTPRTATIATNDTDSSMVHKDLLALEDLYRGHRVVAHPAVRGRPSVRDMAAVRGTASAANTTARTAIVAPRPRSLSAGRTRLRGGDLIQDVYDRLGVSRRLDLTPSQQQPRQEKQQRPAEASVSSSNQDDHSSGSAHNTLDNGNRRAMITTTASTPTRQPDFGSSDTSPSCPNGYHRSATVLSSPVTSSTRGRTANKDDVVVHGRPRSLGVSRGRLAQRQWPPSEFIASTVTTMAPLPQRTISTTGVNRWHNHPSDALETASLPNTNATNHAAAARSNGVVAASAVQLHSPKHAATHKSFWLNSPSHSLPDLNLDSSAISNSMAGGSNAISAVRTHAEFAKEFNDEKKEPDDGGSGDNQSGDESFRVASPSVKDRLFAYGQPKSAAVQGSNDKGFNANNKKGKAKAATAITMTKANPRAVDPNYAATFSSREHKPKIDIYAEHRQQELLKEQQQQHAVEGPTDTETNERNTSSVPSTSVVADSNPAKSQRGSTAVGAETFAMIKTSGTQDSSLTNHSVQATAGGNAPSTAAVHHLSKRSKPISGTTTTTQPVTSNSNAIAANFLASIQQQQTQPSTAVIAPSFIKPASTRLMLSSSTIPIVEIAAAGPHHYHHHHHDPDGVVIAAGDSHSLVSSVSGDEFVLAPHCNNQNNPTSNINNNSNLYHHRSTVPVNKEFYVSTTALNNISMGTANNNMSSLNTKRNSWGERNRVTAYSSSAPSPLVGAAVAATNTTNKVNSNHHHNSKEHATLGSTNSTTTITMSQDALEQLIEERVQAQVLALENRMDLQMRRWMAQVEDKMRPTTSHW